MSDTSETQNMLQRLDRLERENRRLKLLWLLAACGVAAAVVVSCTSRARSPGEVQEVVRARSFEVYDEDGKRRALLGLSEGGKSGLWLYDKDGEPRASLGFVKDAGPVLALYAKGSTVEENVHWRADPLQVGQGFLTGRVACASCADAVYRVPETLEYDVAKFGRLCVRCADAQGIE